MITLVLSSVVIVAFVCWLWQDLQRPPNFPPGMNVRHQSVIKGWLRGHITFREVHL